MFRPALSIVFVAALAASAAVGAKTSIPSLQQNEIPCPANNVETSSAGAPASAAPTAPAAAESTATTRSDSRAARQRWKALVPGTLKSTS
jgi:hypothetical protein